MIRFLLILFAFTIGVNTSVSFATDEITKDAVELSVVDVDVDKDISVECMHEHSFNFMNPLDRSVKIKDVDEVIHFASLPLNNDFKINMANMHVDSNHNYTKTIRDTCTKEVLEPPLCHLGKKQ